MLPWRTDLDSALQENRKAVQARYVQMATVREDGTPANRTLVFRGFHGDNSTLLFVSDARTSKSRELRRNPFAEICWYFPESMQQFRILGEVDVVEASSPDDEKLAKRAELWRIIDNNVRQLILWPEPGKLRSGIEGFAHRSFDPEIIPENFAVLFLQPKRVDFLDLIPYPHRRMLYQLEPDGSWSMQAVNP